MFEAEEFKEGHEAATASMFMFIIHIILKDHAPVNLIALISASNAISLRYRCFSCNRS